MLGVEVAFSETPSLENLHGLFCVFFGFLSSFPLPDRIISPNLRIIGLLPIEGGNGRKDVKNSDFQVRSPFVKIGKIGG
jgi:hypothetical protein